VFGGQVIGQALVAATRTVDGRPPHSMHAYFLLAGDPKVPIVYEVDRIRDGKSFTTRAWWRSSTATPIFSCRCRSTPTRTASTTRCRCRTCPPEALPSDAEIKERYPAAMPEPVRRYYERERPIELRPVEFGRYLGQSPTGRTLQRLDPRHRPAAGRPRIHRCVLAYASDMTLLDTALVPHGRSVFDRTSWRQPRPCAVVSPAVPRRRVAALRPGLARTCTARAASPAA
jgi:acyl-CoA thioesterase II